MQPTGKMDDKAIFNAIRVIDSPDERRAHLRNACGDDIEQRNRVAALLQKFEPDSPFLESPASELHHPLETPPIHEAPEQIGPYRIREEIGEGGMGVVYMAQQSEPVRRKVALKVIKPGMDSRQVIARFEAERQALAVMNHSGIAGILDAGMTDEGRPFFVMEFVPGTRIDKYCDDARLPVNDRLRLLVDVCQAVQHAHQKGIIHRDLKPSNILVTRKDGMPAVKIIDFGIAKALDHDLTEKTLFTHASEMIGTPAYMSPEQVEGSGLNVDTRSDVYSLGVVLYKLLAGVTPFDKETLSSARPDEMRRMICQDDPLRPSRRISTLNNNQVSTITERRRIDSRRLSLSIQRELDWVVMKALEKDPLRRYESASALAADLQRYLDDDVVEACPPSNWYRLRKYAGRHKGVLTAAGLIAITLLASTAISVSYALQSARSEALAETRLQKSQQDFQRALTALDTVVDEFSSAELAQLPGLARTRDATLERILTLYDEVAEDHAGETSALQQKAIAYQKIARIYGVMGRRNEEEAALDQGITIIEELLVAAPDNQSMKDDLVTLLFARLHSPIRSAEARLADVERALILQRELFIQDPQERTHRLGLLLFKVAERLPTDSPRAYALVTESIRIADEQRQRPHPSSYHWLAKHALHEDNWIDTDANYRLAIDGFRLSSEAGHRVDTRILSELCSEFAQLLNSRQHFEEAQQFYRTSVEVAKQLRRDYGSIPWYHEHLHRRLRNYMLDARSPAQQAEADRMVVQVFDTPTQAQPETGWLHAARSASLLRRSDAEKALTRAINEFPDEEWYLVRRAEHYRQAGDTMKAINDLASATDVAKGPDNHAAVAWRLITLSRELSEEGDFENAMQAAQLHNHRIADVWFTDVALSEAWLGLHEYKKALRCIEVAISAVPHEEWSQRWWIHKRHAQALFGLGRFEECVAALGKALELNPSDASIVGWIGAGRIAACHDENFRDGIRQLADQAVKLTNGSADSISARASVLLALDDQQQARSDIEKLLKQMLTQDNTRGYSWYRAAMLAIRVNDLPRYRELCQAMLTRFNSSDDPNDLHFAAWSSCLLVDATDERLLCVTIAEQAVKAEPTNKQYLNGLGAAQFRANDYEAALNSLSTAADLKTGKTSNAYIAYFRAMTEHQLGRQQDANASLSDANKLAQQELSDVDSPAAWNRRLTLELLRKEAEALIGNTEGQ